MPLWHNRHIADSRGKEQDGKPTEPASRRRKANRESDKQDRIAAREPHMRRDPWRDENEGQRP